MQNLSCMVGKWCKDWEDNVILILFCLILEFNFIFFFFFTVGLIKL